jgi:uncharacterized membrane protein YidH (DUF202 family)
MPDHREPTTDSQLANDRTFLASLRTGIALFGLGFVVAKVALIVERGTGGVSDQALYSGVGVLLVLSGAALVVFGCLQHANLAKVLSGDEQASPPRWPRTMTAGAVAGSVLLSGLIIVTT